MPFPESKPVLPDETTLQFVIFRLGPQNFAIEIKRVLEVLNLCKITPVPTAPDFLEGVIELRGHLIPMIDLRKRFGLSVQNDSQTRIIILRMKKMRIGLIVDSAHDVIEVPLENIQAPPPIARMHSGDYVLAVAKAANELYLILDLDRILTSAEQVRLNELNVSGPGTKDVSVSGS